MIDEVTILLPLQPHVVYGSGDVFRAEGKNVLITGNIGTGKSTLMKAIARSLQYSARFDDKKKMSFPHFSQFVSNSMTSRHTIDKRQSRSQIYERVLPALEHLDNDRENNLHSRLLRSAFLLPAKPCTAGRLRRQLERYSQDEILVEGYMAALPRVAVEIGESLPRLYGILHDLNNDTLMRREFPFARFGHTQITGALPETMACMYVVPGKNRISYSFLPTENRRDAEFLPEYESVDGKPVEDKNGYWLSKHYSSGERRLQALSQVFSREAKLIMLDEPLSGLDEANQDSLQARFMDDDSAQYILTSHDRMLKEALRQNPNWVEWNLSEHIPCDDLSAVSQVGAVFPAYAYLEPRPRREIITDSPF